MKTAGCFPKGQTAGTLLQGTIGLPKSRNIFQIILDLRFMVMLT